MSADDWAELVERNPDGSTHPILIRCSAVRAARPEIDRDGSTITLGLAGTLVHVVEPYPDVRALLR